MDDQSGMSSLRSDSLSDGSVNLPLTRRNAMILGAGAGFGAVVGFSGGPARAVLRFDLNQGNVQPMPIALPDFLAGSPSDRPLSLRRSPTRTYSRAIRIGAPSMPKRL